jgi:RNA polymerase sigma factor (sigma-70 family)
MASRQDAAVDENAWFSGVYRTHARDLRRFAVFLSGDAELADDLVADAFVRAWTVRDRIECATVRGYLFAIVRNLFLHHLRHQRQRQPLDEAMIDQRPGPETRIGDHDELRRVMAPLALLPEIDRAAGAPIRSDSGRDVHSP